MPNTVVQFEQRLEPFVEGLNGLTASRVELFATRAVVELAAVPATLIIFESAKRVHKTLADMVLELGAGRQAALCRELTKKFEEVLRGTLEELCKQIGDRKLKGEIVVLVDRGREVASDEDLEDALKIALRDRSVKDAASFVAEQLRLSRRRVYQAALRLGKDK